LCRVANPTILPGKSSKCAVHAWFLSALNLSCSSLWLITSQDTLSKSSKIVGDATCGGNGGATILCTRSGLAPGKGLPGLNRGTGTMMRVTSGNTTLWTDACASV
jgi:hypothetical protein